MPYVIEVEHTGDRCYLRRDPAKLLPNWNVFEFTRAREEAFAFPSRAEAEKYASQYGVYAPRVFATGEDLEQEEAERGEASRDNDGD